MSNEAQNTLIARLAEWLLKHPREYSRAAKIYQKWGADAARGFLSKVSKIDLRLLKRCDVRSILGIEADHVGYARAVEAHRLAWAVAGWHATAPYTGPDGDDGGGRRGKGGGKKSISRAQTFDALRGGNK